MKITTLFGSLFRVVVAGGVLASTASAQAPTFTFGGGTTLETVPTGVDFATDAIGDAWDFDRASDHVYMFSTDWVGVPTVAGGHLTGTVASTTLNPGIQLQFEGVNGALNVVDKNGVKYPIDPAKFNRISFRMRRNRTPHPFDLLTVFHYQDTTRSSGTGFRYGLSNGYDPDGLRVFVNQSPPADQAKSDRYHLYMMDLDLFVNTTNRIGGTRWDAATVRGVRIELGEGIIKEAQGTLAGATIDVDWVRLTKRGAFVRRLIWSNMGGPVTLTATNGTDTIQIFPDQPPKARAPVTTFPDNSFVDWDYGFLPPGNWIIGAAAGAVTRTVTMTIDAPPIITLTEPDASGGRDFARTIEGDAWDMTNREDVYRRGQLQMIAGEAFTETGLTGTSTGGDPAVDIVSDNTSPVGASFTIDADVYRHLTFTMEYDRKDALAIEALTTLGGVARWIWRANGNNGGPLTNTQDFFLLDGGPTTYSMDLATFTKFGGDSCFDCHLEDPNQPAAPGTDLWQGLISVLRFDPFEPSVPRWFRLANVKLAADDEPNSFGFFAIKWQAIEYAPGTPASPPDVANATITLYYDTDTNPSSGLVQIATNIPTGAGRYNWNVAGLPLGRYWIYATIADIHGNSQSRYSTGPVKVGKVYTPPVDTNGNGLGDNWEAVYGVSAPDGDEDGDGLTNLEEYQGGTHPLIPQTWNLPEGATGFFRERIAIANPGPDAAEITVTFLRAAGAPIVRDYTVLPASRFTITANEVAGLSQAEFSTVVTATRGGVLVERTMLWDASQPNRLYGGHSGKGIQNPRVQWFLAEGEASFFQTFILLANANPTSATATLTFLFEGSAPVAKSYAVPANSRVTVWTNTIAEVAGKPFSTAITSTIPITVERAMYFSTQGLTFNGGHEAAAVANPATDWFVAEGRTGPFFDMYLLLSNPGANQATATINYLRPGGAPVVMSYTLNPQSRTTVHVDSQHADLADTDVSASISATEPIIVERAMYWPDPFTNWYEAHSSAGVTQTGTRWVLPDGELGGPLNWQTYILLANPGTTAATVTLTFLRAGTRTPLAMTRTVPANSRLTVSAGQVAGLQSGEQFSTIVESANLVPIVVEHAIYWDGPNGEFWAAGTNETGVRLR